MSHYQELKDKIIEVIENAVTDPCVPNYVLGSLGDNVTYEHDIVVGEYFLKIDEDECDPGGDVCEECNTIERNVYYKIDSIDSLTDMVTLIKYQDDSGLNPKQIVLPGESPDPPPEEEITVPKSDLLDPKEWRIALNVGNDTPRVIKQGSGWDKGNPFRTIVEGISEWVAGDLLGDYLTPCVVKFPANIDAGTNPKVIYELVETSPGVWEPSETSEEIYDYYDVIQSITRVSTGIYNVVYRFDFPENDNAMVQALFATVSPKEPWGINSVRISDTELQLEVTKQTIDFVGQTTTMEPYNPSEIQIVRYLPIEVLES